MNPPAIELLLVEDDAVDAQMFRRSAKRHGLDYPIHHAEEGEQALAMLRGLRGCWPLVFLDVNMPGVNGHEFLKAVREDEALRGTVVFMLTTSCHDRDVRQAYERNAAGYFRKERLDDLMEAIKHYAPSVQRPAAVAV